MHEQLTFTLFRLNTLCRGFEGGKCLSTSFRKVLPTLVFTDLLKGGLNQMMFLRLVGLAFGKALAWFEVTLGG